jgi:hypothetical protein
VTPFSPTRLWELMRSAECRAASAK